MLHYLWQPYIYKTICLSTLIAHFNLISHCELKDNLKSLTQGHVF